MNKKIITKLNLRHTEKMYGDSAMYGLIVYQYSKNIFCVKNIESDGEIIFFNSKNRLILIEQFIIDVPVYIINAELNLLTK